MEFRHLRYIVAVAEELHFGRAAIRLNISQPPLSHQIQQIEEELGVRIFQRTKRAVQLTEAGKRIVAEAHLVLSQVDHLSRVAARAGEGEIGNLSVGALIAVNDILVDTLSIFAKRYPGVHVELQYMTTGAQIESLIEERIQVGFLALPIQEASLVAEIVEEEPLRIALPKNHPLARCQRVPLSALADQPFILFRRRTTPGLHDLITGICKNAGVSLNVVHEVDSILASLTLVRADLGIAFCVASMQQKSNGIVFRPLEEPEPRVRYGITYRRDAQSPVLSSFLGVVRQVIRRRRPDLREAGSRR
jgi:DNA-binding transcriptional LysR family regulator